MSIMPSTGSAEVRAVITPQENIMLALSLQSQETRAGVANLMSEQDKQKVEIDRLVEGLKATQASLIEILQQEELQTVSFIEDESAKMAILSRRVDRFILAVVAAEKESEEIENSIKGVHENIKDLLKTECYFNTPAGARKRAQIVGYWRNC